MELKVNIYSTPGCRACAALKQELLNSEYIEFITHIDLTEDEESMNLLREKGVLSAPTIGVFYEDSVDFLVGMRPVSDVDSFIKNIVGR